MLNPGEEVAAFLRELDEGEDDHPLVSHIPPAPEPVGDPVRDALVSARFFLENCHYGPEEEVLPTVAKINTALAYLDQIDAITAALDIGAPGSAELLEVGATES